MCLDLFTIGNDYRLEPLPSTGVHFRLTHTDVLEDPHQRKNISISLPELIEEEDQTEEQELFRKGRKLSS